MKERVLRGLAPARLGFVHYSWPLRPTMCPCDLDFCRYLEQSAFRGKSIFHFGTGGHHLVGMHNRRAGLMNDILGLTLSPREQARYVAAVIRDPELGRYYKVLFADIYSLSPACCPRFDLVTLFHLCEFSATNNIGRRMTDRDVLNLFCSKLSPDGRVLFYPGSFGYARALPLIVEAVDAGRLRFEENFRSLSIYRVAGAPAPAVDAAVT